MKSPATFLALLSLLFYGCNSSIEDSRWKIHKEVSLKSAGLVIVCPDSIVLNTETCIRIFLNNTDYKLNSGYINCPLDSIFSFDTATVSISGCNDRFYQVDDTIEIYFKPINLHGEFSKATFLFKDKSNKFYANDTVVKY